MMAHLLQKTPAPGPSERHDLDADDASLPVLQDALARYGDVCRVPSRTRPGAGIVIHDPDAIRHVLLTNRANYVKGAGIDRVRMLLGDGLITSDGAQWQKQRKLVQPAFHGQVLRGFAALIERVNAALLDRWAAHAGTGEPIDLTRDLSVATLEIVLQALFSADLDRLVAAEGANPFAVLTDDHGRDLAFAARFRGLARHVRAMVAARRDEGRVEHDFLSMMMEARDADTGAPMSDRELLDEAMTLIVAGHETTASALNWAWWLLSQHPDVEARLHADAGGDQAEQVAQEAMRLYPPVWLFSRRALADDTVGGFRVDAGSDVFVCPYLLHRHPAHWQRPDAFDPSRFDAAAAAGRNRFAYLPFSAGPRLCIGFGFAMAEMKAHLSMAARRFRLVHVDSAPPEPAFGINLRTRGSVHMRVEAR